MDYDSFKLVIFRVTSATLSHGGSLRPDINQLITLQRLNSLDAPHALRGRNSSRDIF